MPWTWRYEDQNGAGTSPDGFGVEEFPTQADAESWLGENWRDLHGAGVDQVTLLENDAKVYEMSLRPAD